MLETIETNNLSKLLRSPAATDEERQKLSAFSAQCVIKTQEGQPVQ
jgi:hypothetical protein